MLAILTDETLANFVRGQHIPPGLAEVVQAAMPAVDICEMRVSAVATHVGQWMCPLWCSTVHHARSKLMIVYLVTLVLLVMFPLSFARSSREGVAFERRRQPTKAVICKGVKLCVPLSTYAFNKLHCWP